MKTPEKQNERDGGIVSSAVLAEQIATRAHAKQFRRDGVTPYITHPAAVAKRLAGESDDVLATAWLHDVLEDTCITATTLRESGIPAQVVEAVERLTKRRDHSYDFYLEGVRENEIAKKVKVADMLHNLSDNPTQKQIVKYARGLLALLGGPESGDSYQCEECRKISAVVHWECARPKGDESCIGTTIESIRGTHSHTNILI